jgi:glycosyltransferase involved in cell wall biosynthesis
MILSDCPDIVHAHWTYEFALAAILCRLPYVITVRDWPPAILKITRKPYRFVRLLMAMLVFLLGKNFVANSFYLHKKLEFLGRKRLKFLPNGIQSNLFVVGKKSFDFNGKIRIITINNGAGSIKNSGVLLRAFSKLRKVYSNITLRMLGAGYEDGGQFFLWAKEKGLTDGVDFIGKVDFRLVLTELDKAHLLIHSALEESFGNTIIEAMARRVPIIAGKQSGAVPWVVGKAGMLVDVSNSDDIAAAVVAFFSNKKMFSYFSEKGYENAKRRFLLAKIADEYICYYREVLSEC